MFSFLLIKQAVGGKKNQGGKIMCFKMFIKLYGKGLVDIIFEGN